MELKLNKYHTGPKNLETSTADKPRYERSTAPIFNNNLFTFHIDNI